MSALAAYKAQLAAFYESVSANQAAAVLMASGSVPSAPVVMPPIQVGGSPTRAGIVMGTMRASSGCSIGAPAESIIFGSSVAAASGGPGMVGYGMEAVGGATAMTTGLETLGLGLLIGGAIFGVGGAVESLARPSAGSC